MSVCGRSQSHRILEHAMRQVRQHLLAGVAVPWPVAGSYGLLVLSTYEELFSYLLMGIFGQAHGMYEFNFA